jgi:hypothetical protein
MFNLTDGERAGLYSISRKERLMSRKRRKGR